MNSVRLLFLFMADLLGQGQLTVMREDIDALNSLIDTQRHPKISWEEDDNGNITLKLSLELQDKELLS